MKFDRDNLKALRKDLEEALKQVAEKHNIQIVVGNASFTSNDVNWKIQMLAKDDSGKVHDRLAEDFKFYANALGMKPEDLGKEFTVGRDKYRLKGYNGKKRKFPIVAINLSNNKEYGLTLGGVKRALGYKVEQWEI